MNVVTVGIAGPTGSGKSTLARRVARHLRMPVTIMHQDNYYYDLSHLPEEERARTNFDVPEALEWSLLVEHLDALRAGRPVDVPVYQFDTHTRRADTTQRLTAHPVLILEGTLVLWDASIRERLDLKAYVHVDPEMALRRRINRDMRTRGRTLQDVHRQFDEQVRPMTQRYIEPTRQYADVVLDGSLPLNELINALTYRIHEAILAHSRR